jgi:hypothetical protein
LFLTIATFVCTIALAQGGGPPPAPQPQPVQWERAYSADHDFSVWMPGHAAVASKTLSAKNGHPVQYTTMTVDRGTRAYLASYGDYDNQTRIVLQSAIDGILGSWKNPHNIRRRDSSVATLPSITIDFDSQNFHVVMRVFSSRHRLYQLGYVAEGDVFSWESAKGFLNSFRFEPR